MRYLHQCYRCSRNDVLCDEESIWSICRACKLKGPVSPNCPGPSCGGIGTMTPHDYGDVCSKCDSAFPICDKCSTICSFSGNPCDGSYVMLVDRPFSEQLRDCPQPLLSNHQTRTVLGADNLLGEKRPSTSTSSSDTPSKKPRAESKVSPSVSTHKETEFPSPSEDEAPFAEFEPSLDNSTLEDFDDNSPPPWSLWNTLSHF